jgi:hypothetical protein
LIDSVLILDACGLRRGDGLEAETQYLCLVLLLIILVLSAGKFVESGGIDKFWEDTENEFIGD